MALRTRTHDNINFSQNYMQRKQVKYACYNVRNTVHTWKIQNELFTQEYDA